MDWDSSQPSWDYDYCCTESSYDNYSAACYVGGIVAYWPIASGTAVLTDNRSDATIDPRLRGDDKSWSSPGQLKMYCENVWSNSATATVAAYNGAIIGLRGDAVVASGCTFSTSNRTTKATKGCGGSFTNTNTGGWFTKYVELTAGAIDGALSNGRTSGSITGISQV